MYLKSMSALAAGLAMSASAASADFTLNILHFNDFHSRFEPISKYDGSCSEEKNAEGKCFGGVARMKSFFDSRREALGENTVVLSAGDLFQGTLYYTTYKGTATAEFMNAMGIDATAVGNHEFDDGPAVLGAFIDAAKFPVVSTNTMIEREPQLKGKIVPYAVLEVGGEKIGIISAVATDTDELSSPGPNVSFAEEIGAFKHAAPELKAMGVNKIIAVTHVGYNRDLEIAAQAAGVDVIVGGHSNTYLSSSDPKRDGPYPTWVSNDVDPEADLVPVVQAYAYSKYIGELTVTFDDNGVVLGAEGDTYLLDSKIPQDAAFTARLKELAGPIEELKSTPVGETAALIDGDRKNCRARECEMGVLVAEAMLDRVKGQGVTIAIQNGGGLRASIEPGKVTMGDVLTVLPFQNTLATFQLKGSDVVAALENGVSQVEDGKGRFPQVAGLRYVWDINVPPMQGRIQAVQVMQDGAWVDIDPDAVYGVVSNNYMRSGGDGYKVFARNGMNAYDYGPGLENVVADYIAEHSPYQPALRGNIIEGKGF